MQSKAYRTLYPDLLDLDEKDGRKTSVNSPTMSRREIAI